MSISVNSFTPSEDKYSRMLFTSRERTVSEGQDLLDFLDAARVPLTSIYSGTEINLPAPNGDKINGVHFKGEQKRAIIFLHGNGCFYENAAARPLHWIESLKDNSGASPHLIVFNPRGTGKSSGLTEPSRVAEDLAILFDFLVKEQGVSPEHVVFAGHSMGGYFAVFGALQVQNECPGSKVHLLLDRSFPDLHSRVAAKAEKYAKNKFSELYYNAKLHRAIDSYHWARNSIDALEQLRGRVCVIYHRKDGVVPYKDSFHCKLDCSDIQKSYSFIELVEDPADVVPHGKYHNREFTDSENQRIIAELKLMLGISQKNEESSFSMMSPLPNLLKV